MKSVIGGDEVQHTTMPDPLAASSLADAAVRQQNAVRSVFVCSGGAMAAPDDNTSVVIQYYVLRSLIGLAGLALPLVVWLGAAALDGEGQLGSISTYYYSSTRDAFVGILIVTGVFLTTYQGYRDKKDRLWGWLSDNALTNLAGVAALGIALFPTAACAAARCSTDFPAAPWTTASAVHVIHLGSAAVFFVAMGVLARFSFSKSDRKGPGAEARHWTYVTAGTVILLCAGAMAVYGLLPEVRKAALDRYNPIFWGEAVGIWAFGVAWLAKGRALRTGLNVIRGRPIRQGSP